MKTFSRSIEKSLGARQFEFPAIERDGENEENKVLSIDDHLGTISDELKHDSMMKASIIPADPDRLS